MTLRITDIRQAHPRFFERSTVRAFGDISYRVLHDKQRQPYLVRYTCAWTDMFGGERVPHWRINPIGPNLEILPLDDRIFTTLTAVKNTLGGVIE